MKKDLTILEILGIAVRAEIESYNMYKRISQGAANPATKEKFAGLANEEKAHRTILENLYRKHGGRIKLTVPRDSLRGIKLDLAKNSPAEIVKMAIEKERAARRFYMDAYKKATDRSGKFILKYLADFELNHERELQHELKALEEYPMWWDFSGPGIQFIGP